VIDAASGTIAFDRGTVSKDLTRSVFLDSALGRDARLIVDNQEYRSYRLAEPMSADGRQVAAQLLRRSPSRSSTRALALRGTT
jgi:hypothetical protein